MVYDLHRLKLDLEEAKGTDLINFKLQSDNSIPIPEDPQDQIIFNIALSNL